ncbi:hypothetical protein RQP46_002454 [Phenoliferia psychrophenolica]
MARASFATLPLELKERIVEMVGDQEDIPGCPIVGQEWRARHVNGLSSLALVNKELRALAAKHQFKVLYTARASKPVFRFRILPRYAHHIKEVNFFKDVDDGGDYTMTILAQLPALRTLRFTVPAAAAMFGREVTLDPDPADDLKTFRIDRLLAIAHRVKTLVLHHFQPSETVALIRGFPNLTTLGLLNLDDRDRKDDIIKMTGAIASLRHLRSLTVDLFETSHGGWPIEALSPLERDPPPLHTLQLIYFPLNQGTLHCVRLFAPNLKTLSLELALSEAAASEDLAPVEPFELPHLAHLNVSLPRDRLPDLFRLFQSTPALSHLSFDYGESTDTPQPTDPAVLGYITSRTALVQLSLGCLYLEHPVEATSPASGLPLPSYLAAYANLIHSRGLDPSVLEEPHLSPFHPKAKLGYTEDEHVHLTGSLRRTLEFGLLELDRMAAEGSVARTVEWVPMLKPLEAKRLAWKD